MGRKKCAADVLQSVQSWILIKMLKLGLVNILNFEFIWDGDVWLRFWSKCLVKILKMKFDQDFCLNLWYDPILYFGKMNSTLGSVVPLAMFYLKKIGKLKMTLTPTTKKAPVRPFTVATRWRLDSFSFSYSFSCRLHIIYASSVVHTRYFLS